MNYIKLIFFLNLFFVLINKSYSEAVWEKIATGENGDVMYVDVSSVIKKGDFLYFWELFDYATPDEDGILSDKSFMKVDCELRKNTALQSVFYSQNKGKGKVLFNDNYEQEQWDYPAPDTIGYIVMDFVCKNFNETF